MSATASSQCETSGELRSALAAGLWDRGTPAELGAVVTGAAAGRAGDDDVTICDLTGTGAQDTAIATLARRICAERGVGSSMPA